MHMRMSRVLQKLRAGDAAFSFKLNLTCPRAAEIAAFKGFDCIWLDMEHTACDWSVVENQIYASKIHGADVMVRVARGSYSDYIRPLELDAAGILVPHIQSAQDARDVARMTRFHPIGRRPVDSGNTDGAFCNIPYLDYLRDANQMRFVGVQIEDPEPLDEVEEIAKVEGIDFIYFGPADFGHGIGAPGVADHPRLLEARRRVVEAALAAGKFAGTTALPSTVESILAMGYRFVNVGADVLGLSQYCDDCVAAAHSARDKVIRRSPGG